MSLLFLTTIGWLVVMFFNSLMVLASPFPTVASAASSVGYSMLPMAQALAVLTQTVLVPSVYLR